MDFKEEIIEELKKEVNIEIVLEIPPDHNLGDYAFPCFSLAKIYKKSPNDIALELSKKIKASFLEKVEVNGSYLNFFINRKLFSENVLKEAFKDRKIKTKRNKILVEYCHANTHKAFHIGHTRNICLGESICRILEENGNKVIRANYQGDIGMHVAKTVYGLLNLNKLELKEPKENKGRWLGLVYAASSNLAKDEKVAEEINIINQKLYAGDKKLESIWKESRKWSIDYFEKIVYPDFNVKFNRFYFESEVEKDGIKIANKLLKNEYAKLSDGAIIVDFEKEGLGVYLILKSDGTALYSTKDLALAELQEKEYKPDLILHIVGSEQNLYFKQLFKTIGSYNKKLAEKEKHLSYELVILPTGKMSSREGKVILYDDTLNEMIEYTEKEIREKWEKIDEKELSKRAKKIAMAAIKYSMLMQDMRKTIVFDQEKTLSSEGDTGPYLLYSYVRANSILKKSKKKIKISVKEITEKEFLLVKKISYFNETLMKAGEQMNPYLIAKYIFDLAQLFNEFYHSSQVIGSEREEFLLGVVKSFKKTLSKGLYLLGIETIEEM